MEDSKIERDKDRKRGCLIHIQMTDWQKDIKQEETDVDKDFMNKGFMPPVQVEEEILLKTEIQIDRKTVSLKER